jgi:tripartite-type tricarboxylate transporter receptor subunit TctC
VAYAKANPGKLNYGSPGSGSQNRLEMEVLRKLENLDMVHIPYKGGAGPAITGLIGGETHLMFVTVSSAIGHVKGGRLKLLGVSSANRIGAAPDVPTLAESGYPDLTGGSWQGVFVPAGTPKEVVERLLPAVLQTMQTQDVVTRLNNGGVEVVTSSPAAFSEFVAAETRKWARVVKESNATPD